MEQPNSSQDLRDLPIPEQMKLVEQTIEGAVSGIKKSFTIDAQIIATYALSTSAIKGVKCRVIPLREDDIDEWQVEIAPKSLE
tara:strand:+ start:855 stop:1103 length:249 start_codon:yes stop_codon:yes gene_type:complete